MFSLAMQNSYFFKVKTNNIICFKVKTNNITTMNNGAFTPATKVLLLLLRTGKIGAFRTCAFIAHVNTTFFSVNKSAHFS